MGSIRGINKSQFLRTSIRLSFVVIFGMYLSSSGFRKVYECDTIPQSDILRAHSRGSGIYTSCIAH